ncbi:Serine phosphatase RsbU, regulator of sigma subunit [[Actinomadura] parvosata subsp. kistnae]|uniref:ANTAR domain-containing protein n=1 Tax=[Actinomadura] parvosata TaxID=1955412 RepID=UPI000D26EB04|nr:Serine phosphatase RsbU, regulator of sigma subunit [Actinomadura parvosata subsp. kistnae]
MHDLQHPPAPDSGAAGPAGLPDAGTNVGRLAATIERLREAVREAQHAAEGRALIEVAKGILIERLGCGLTEAARQIATLAEQAGVSPIEMSADIINHAARDRISETAREFLNAARSREAAPTGGDSGVAVRMRSAENGMLQAGDAQAVAESLLQHALTPLGATAVAVWAAGHDASLALAGYAGFNEAEAARWRYVPPGVATPARQALTERKAIWLRALSDVGLPSIGWHATPDGGRASVPAGTGGRVLGVLEISWPEPLEPPPPQIVKQIEALAELCAHTLERPAGPPAAARRRS